MDPACVGKLSWKGNVTSEVEVRDVSGRVKTFDPVERNSLETLLSFGMSLECRLQSLLFPRLTLYFSR
jgi:hypothetical protein